MSPLPLLAHTLLIALFGAMHPIHLSVTDISHNEQTKALEISCRFFIDDFEQEVEADCGQKLALGTEKEHPKANAYIDAYLRKNFTIIVNGKPQERVFVGKEPDNEGLWVYIEIPDVKKMKSLEVENLVLLKKFEDQRHFVNIKAPSGKKTIVLDARSPKAFVSF